MGKGGTSIMHSSHGPGSVARSARPTSNILKSEKGMALMTVLIFSFVFLVLTMTFFTVAGYEAGQAENRENSTRAFYLADGAIEKAKGKLLDDAAWEDGFDKTPQDGGFYKVTVSDTLYNEAWHKKFYAEGYYGRTKRDVEVIADIEAATLGLSIYARDDIILKGKICLDGHAHADDEIVNDDKFDLTCDPTWSNKRTINPPPVYIEPDSFPGATYYIVTVNDGPANKDTLFIKNPDWSNVPGGIYPNGTTPHADFMWTCKSNGVLEVTIKSSGVMDQDTGIFRKQGADTTVVVNFGGKFRDYEDNPGYQIDHDSTNVIINGPPAGGVITIKSTIINCRYKLPMADTEERLQRSRWSGGEINTKSHATFEPTYCIAFITHKIQGNAQQSLGTAARPALSYVMEAGDFSTGQWTIYGSLVCLGDISIGGGVNLTFDRDFIDCLPDHLALNWPEGASGVMNILRWREPPPRS